MASFSIPNSVSTCHLLKAKEACGVKIMSYLHLVMGIKRSYTPTEGLANMSELSNREINR